MSMMRRGPLDRYSAEWVLRQADAHHASGCIEFHGSVPLTVYLQGGLVHGAVLGIHEDPPPLVEHLSEEGARRATVSVVARALGSDSGWYFHDPLGGPREPGAWGWDVASLVAEARSAQSRPSSRGSKPSSPGAWAGVDVALRRPPHDGTVTLTADAWAVVVALASSAPLTDVRTRLDWPAERLVEALADLRRAEALALANDPARPVATLT